MNLTSVHFRTQYGDDDRQQWGVTYDQLPLCIHNVSDKVITRSQLDTIVTDSVTLVACEDTEARELSRRFIASFSKQRGGSGIGEQSALELIAKVGMLLNEIASNPK